MLTVVETEPVVANRGRETTEDRAPLEDHDLRTGIRGLKCCGHPGQAATDNSDDGRAHGRAPARLRAATSAFSQVGKDMRPRVTAIGSALIRTSKRL